MYTTLLAQKSQTLPGRLPRGRCLLSVPLSSGDRLLSTFRAQTAGRRHLTKPLLGSGRGWGAEGQLSPPSPLGGTPPRQRPPGCSAAGHHCRCRIAVVSRNAYLAALGQYLAVSACWRQVVTLKKSASGCPASRLAAAAVHRDRGAPDAALRAAQQGSWSGCQ